jgi:hypothetical protein
LSDGKRPGTGRPRTGGENPMVAGLMNSDLIGKIESRDTAREFRLRPEFVSQETRIQRKEPAYSATFSDFRELRVFARVGVADAVVIEPVSAS